MTETPQQVSPLVSPRESPPEPPPEPVKLTDPKAMRALAHPVRMALLELLAVHETLTATQASDLLGESPANCAFHLRTLGKYGYVREAGGGRGRERPWTIVNESITITNQQEDPQAALAADALSRVMLGRWLDRARQVFDPGAQLPGWEEASGWMRVSVFLTAEETENLRQEIRRVLHPYEARRSDPARRPAGALPIEWAIFTAPITDK